jgi:hypothetical protein
MGNRDKRLQLPRSQGKLCAYCGKNPATEEEHVVARAFFGDHQPDNPFKVPACRSCNSLKGDRWPGAMNMNLDEEYVRTIFASEREAEKHPVARSLMHGAIARSFTNSPKFRQSLQRASKLVMGRTPLGILIPNVPAIAVDRLRIERVLTKIIRGLHFAISGGIRLDKGYRTSFSPPLAAPQIAEQVKAVSDADNSGLVEVGKDGAFRFICARSDKEFSESVWLLCFYDTLTFHVQVFRNVNCGKRRAELERK